MKKMICHNITDSCGKKATHGFISKSKKILQPQVYCFKCAKKVINNGAFPRCNLINLKKMKIR